MQIKTKHRIETEKRERAIYDRFEALMATKGAMASAVTEIVMREFNIGWSAVWATRRRVEGRIKQELEEKERQPAGGTVQS